MCKNEMLNIFVRRLHHPSFHIHSNIGVNNINSVIVVQVYIGDKLVKYI